MTKLLACKNCGNTDIRKDADAIWDASLQQWVLAGLYDSIVCMNEDNEACNGNEVEVIEVVPQVSAANVVAGKVLEGPDPTVISPAVAEAPKLPLPHELEEAIGDARFAGMGFDFIKCQGCSFSAVVPSAFVYPHCALCEANLGHVRPLDRRPAREGDQPTSVDARKGERLR